MTRKKFDVRERNMMIKFCDKPERHSRLKVNGTVATPLINQFFIRVGICKKGRKKKLVKSIKSFAAKRSEKLTTAENQRTALAIHRKVSQLHWARSSNCEPKNLHLQKS